MQKSDFKVGQVVYLRCITGSDASRRLNKNDIDTWVIERVVRQVDTKYITVGYESSIYGEVKFDINNNFKQVVDIGGREYELFLVKSEAIDDVKTERMFLAIREHFNFFLSTKKTLSLDDLNAIADIIGIPKL